MKIAGRCLCGHVTYRAEIDPERVAVCHCMDCQIHSASAFGVVAGIVGEFELLTGSMKTFVKTADSGTKRALTFCPKCGTRIYAKTVGEGSDFWGLRVGTINQRAELQPRIQVWCDSALPWVNELRDLPGLPQQAGLAQGAGSGLVPVRP